MKLRNGKIAVMLACLISIGGVINADAHSGRTDSSGGHRDNKNKSGLGSYHYHCQGNPAHLHTNGCPYADKPTTTTNGGSNDTANVKSEAEIRQAEEAKQKANEAKVEKEKESINKKGYETGLKEGYEKKENLGDKYEGNYKDEYLAGYNKGFQEGTEKIETEIKSVSDEAYETGLNGQENDNKYDNELFKTAYNASYTKGFDEYINKNVEEYKAKGEKDAEDDRDAEVFNESINNKFKEVYLSAYSTKKGEIEQQKKEDTENTVIGVVGLGAIAGGVVLYKKKKKKKIS